MKILLLPVIFSLVLTQTIHQVTKKVDLKGSVVREKATLEVSKESSSVFYIAIPLDLNPFLADVSVTVEGIPSKVTKDRIKE